MRERAMGDFFVRTVVRVVGSIVVGWLAGAAFGLGVSDLIYGDEANQLPMLTVPLGIIIVFCLSFFVF
jgi:hypothetical protein